MDRKVTRPVRTASTSFTPVEAAIALLLIVSLFAVTWYTGRSHSAPVMTTSVRVQQGDTLWTIAQRHPAQGRSVQETVHLLVTLNELDGTTIDAGSSLVVPAADDNGSVALAMR